MNVEKCYNNITAIQEMAGRLTNHKAALEGNDLTQEQLDQMVTWYGEFEAWVDMIKEAYGIE